MLRINGVIMPMYTDYKIYLIDKLWHGMLSYESLASATSRIVVEADVLSD